MSPTSVDNILTFIIHVILPILFSSKSLFNINGIIYAVLHILHFINAKNLNMDYTSTPVKIFSVFFKGCIYIPNTDPYLNAIYLLILFFWETNRLDPYNPPTSRYNDYTIITYMIWTPLVTLFNLQIKDLVFIGFVYFLAFYFISSTSENRRKRKLLLLLLVLIGTKIFYLSQSEPFVTEPTGDNIWNLIDNYINQDNETKNLENPIPPAEATADQQQQKPPPGDPGESNQINVNLVDKSEESKKLGDESLVQKKQEEGFWLLKWPNFIFWKIFGGTKWVISIILRGILWVFWTIVGGIKWIFMSIYGGIFFVYDMIVRGLKAIVIGIVDSIYYPSKELRFLYLSACSFMFVSFWIKVIQPSNRF